MFLCNTVLKYFIWLLQDMRQTWCQATVFWTVITCWFISLFCKLWVKWSVFMLLIWMCFQSLFWSIPKVFLFIFIIYLLITKPLFFNFHLELTQCIKNTQDNSIILLSRFSHVLQFWSSINGCGHVNFDNGIKASESQWHI